MAEATELSLNENVINTFLMLLILGALIVLVLILLKPHITLQVN